MDTNEIIKDLCSLEIRKKRRIWEPFMRKYNCDIICEIGVERGLNFPNMIQHNPKTAVAVDAWINDGVLSRNLAMKQGGFIQEELDKQYEDFKKFAIDKPFIQIYREYSTKAVKRFEDNYFDLIYIDADHTYESILRDIQDWYPKVKKERFLLGDDYRQLTIQGVRFGVIEAVNRFTRENNLSFFELPIWGWGIIKL